MTQTVGDIMTPRPITVGMDATMREVRDIFESKGFHHLVVLGKDRRAVGVLSDRDLLRTVSPFVGKLAERSADVASLERKAHQVMSRQLIAARPNTLLRAAARVMLDHKISCMPVVDRELRLVGILTRYDIVRWSIGRMDGGLELPGTGVEAPRRAA
ncbi:MAG: CBS domain-containing protein [Phycisphaerales bacterium]|nr:CBS domain-containing protein [Planctomycetota bacterium]MCH8507965.1 CBS domain-containing protein [Phycisphaerales bacterium]